MRSTRTSCGWTRPNFPPDRKSTRLNSSHTEIYTLSLHDALPIYQVPLTDPSHTGELPYLSLDAEHPNFLRLDPAKLPARSEEHTSELQSHRDLHSFPTRRSSDLSGSADRSVAHGGVAVPVAGCGAPELPAAGPGQTSR